MLLMRSTGALAR